MHSLYRNGNLCLMSVIINMPRGLNLQASTVNISEYTIKHTQWCVFVQHHPRAKYSNNCGSIATLLPCSIGNIQYSETQYESLSTVVMSTVVRLEIKLWVKLLTLSSRFSSIFSCCHQFDECYEGQGLETWASLFTLRHDFNSSSLSCTNSMCKRSQN